MGKVYDALDARLIQFIEAQHVFFVASAPRAGEHVNLSPKGAPGLRVLSPRRVAWLDVVGSGAETIAHVRENGRVTLLFCAFTGAPNLLRLYGHGRVLEPGDEGFAQLAAHWEVQPGARSIVTVELTRIADSCGFGVPLYDYAGERKQMTAWAQRKGADALRRYQLENNRQSLDGLPALRATHLGDAEPEPSS